MRNIIRSDRLRRAALLAGPTALLLASTFSAAPASAALLVTVPPGCGFYSGTMVAANRLFDLRAGGALGAPGAPYLVPLVANPIVVASNSADYINGTGLNDVICGRGGADVINGGSGDDAIFGGDDDDVLSGQENSDTISGGNGNDEIWGDALVTSIFDTRDTLQGGSGSDDLYGGEGNDTMDGGTGGAGLDFGDGGNSTGLGDDCSEFEVGPVNCP